MLIKNHEYELLMVFWCIFLSGVLAIAMVLGMIAGVGFVQVKADDEITLNQGI